MGWRPWSSGVGPLEIWKCAAATQLGPSLTLVNLELDPSGCSPRCQNCGNAADGHGDGDGTVTKPVSLIRI